jgi:DNA transformation protein and related proteins
MASSPSFERIERDTLKLCATIPMGRVCTYADVGAVIDVPARHVAYIVSRLSDATRAQVPVHRLVGSAGKLPAKPAELAKLLADEGIAVAHGAVVNLPSVRYAPSAATVQSAKLERTTRPPEHTRGADGGAALSELRGLGPVSVAMLGSVGVTSAAQLRKADVFLLFKKIRTLHPRTSINLLYALLGAVNDQDWRTVARDRRTEVLMRLEDMGLI